MTTTILLPERRIAWGAISSGVAVAIAAQFTLNLLGAGIGFAAADPVTDDAGSVKAIGIGAGLWWLLSGLVAMFLGGWVAGRQAPASHPHAGAFHGLITWAATTIVGLLLIGVFTGALMGGALSLVNARVNASFPSFSMQQDRGTESRGTAEASLNRANPENMSPGERRDLAENAANALATASMWAAFALLLGAAVSIWGGSRGMKKEGDAVYGATVVGS